MASVLSVSHPTLLMRPIEPVAPAPVGARTMRDPDGDEPMALLMREVSRELAADAIMVAWHDGAASPVLLFEGGDCQPRSAIEQALVETASRAAGRRDVAAGPQWAILDDVSGARAMTSSVTLGPGVVTITTLFRGVGATARAQARDATKRLMPMILPFLRLWSARGRMVSRVRGLTAAVNKSDVGILLINREGRLLFANAAAEALIAQGDGLRRSAGTLSGGRLADTLRLQAAIEHVVQPEAALPGALAPVVALTRRVGRPLLAAVVASETMPSSSDESAAIVYVFNPDQDLRPLIEPACKLYGLSPVETRLTCFLTDGVTLADAATRMRVREQTARSYLKQIFLKTDTNRQAELVWLMLKSSVRTAPGCRAVLI